MKCELCHNADAAAVIHRMVDGQDRELYVCKACAAKEAQAARPARDRKRPQLAAPDFSVTIAAAPGSDAPPPPLVDALVQATMEFMNKIAGGKGTDPACPVCGTRWKDVEETGHVGCPACYKAFSGRLMAHLRTGQRGLRHLGKIPPGASGEGARKFLERQLAEAVAKQNYEEASRLRDELRALNDGRRPGGPRA